MNCQGVQECAGDAIDRSLSNGIAIEFEEHLLRCPPCRRDIALEKLSKFMVQKYVQWRTTPPSTSAAVLFSLHGEYQRQPVALQHFPGLFLTRRVLAPALLGSMVAAFFFSQVSRHSEFARPVTAATAPTDIIQQSLSNFGLLRTGRFESAAVFDSPERIRAFLQQSNLNFNVHVPQIREYDWCGGAATELGGIGQAHVMYKIGNELLYVFEVKDGDALEGRQPPIPVAVKQALAQTGWYTDAVGSDGNVVVWRADEAVCVAVSTMPKGQLLMLLAAH